MLKRKGLFENQKLCEFCRRPLSLSYPGNCCPQCLENKLFQEVKIYIRENVVNEHDVAAHFNISVKQVKKWIREGRIEYRTPNETRSLTGVRCQRCGTPITFGSLCSKCTRENSASKGFALPSLSNDSNSQMRFLDYDDKKSRK